MKITYSIEWAMQMKTCKGASNYDKDFSSNLNTPLYHGLMKNLSERNNVHGYGHMANSVHGYRNDTWSWSWNPLIWCIFLIHYNMPKSMDEYCKESRKACRQASSIRYMYKQCKTY